MDANLNNLKFINNWNYMHENLTRHFESAIRTEFPDFEKYKVTVVFDNPSSLSTNPFTSYFFNQYSSLTLTVNNMQI